MTEKQQLNEKKANIISTLKEGKHKFSFKKADGTIREAVGTLADEFLPEQHKQKTTGASRKAKRADDQVTYFDTDKQAFRSFKLDRFIQFLD